MLIIVWGCDNILSNNIVFQYYLRYVMKRVSCLIYLGLVLVVPITTYAELTGEIILRLPGDGNNELHITTIENPLDSHKIFSQKEKFVGLSVQRKWESTRHKAERTQVFRRTLSFLIGAQMKYATLHKVSLMLQMAISAFQLREMSYSHIQTQIQRKSDSFSYPVMRYRKLNRKSFD